MQLPSQTRQELAHAINGRNVESVSIEIHIMFPICYECGAAVSRDLLTDKDEPVENWQCTNCNSTSHDWIHGGANIVHQLDVAQFLKMLNS
jgi:DNA-directed RNA polymerase subunit RPC12/RpoP